MRKWYFKICSFLLVMTLVVNMLPMSVWAEEISANANVSAPSLGQTEAKKAKIQVLGENTTKRTEYSKDFLLSDGTYLSAVYADPIHYEKDGSWQEIDNTLKVSDEGTYINTAGDWSVSMPQSINRMAPVTVSRDGYTLSFTMSGELRKQGNLEVAAVQAIGELTTMTVDGKVEAFRLETVQTVAGQVQKIDTSAAKAATAYPEVVLDKNASQLRYGGVYANTELRYDLHGNTLKESIILQSYSSNLRGYKYTLQTGELVPVVNEDGSIYFMATDKNPVFVMKAPYLIDEAEQCSYDVKVSLIGSNGTYTLTYLLPTTWLASEERAWPVVLDPAVTTRPSVLNTRDHTVAERGSYHYERSVLECGYGNVNGKQRIFLKYRELPKLSAADVIVDAQVTLYKIENSDSTVTVDVHKVGDTWESESLTWANKPDYDPAVEDYALIDRYGYYYWNVTDIVRDWYSGENTGMMFKASDQYEDGSKATWKQFASSDNGNSAWMPSLQITYRNNNGIESYWDYTASSAGRAGTGYVNSYTGNLAWIRSDMGFGGNRMPVSISHVYNLNDAVAQNTDDDTNPFGMGHGWRTNFNQRITSTYINSHKYYIWEDADGTSHYFYNESYGVFKDEDGLELTLRSVNVQSNTGVTGGQYSITDKGGNIRVFDSSGRLIRMLNNQENKSSITIAYANDKIDYVKDGAGRKYKFTYTNGLLTSIEYLGAGTTTLAITIFSYVDSDLVQVTDTDGKFSYYTYSDHVLVSAVDVDGYKLEYTYYTLAGAHQPYRVQGITEYDGSVKGGSLALQYEHNQTTFTDALGNKQILQFNNWGNVISIQDDEGHAQYAQYAQDADSAAKGNQLMLSSKLQNTVANLLDDSSFENGTLWHPFGTYDADNAVSQSVSYLGSKSLCIGSANSAVSNTFSIPAGATYTFSAYVKTEDRAATLALGGKTSETLAANKDWTRLEVSYTNDSDQEVSITPVVQAQGSSGNVYVDCVQLEKTQTASRYNLVENGDFRYTTRWSSLAGRVAENAATPMLDSNVYKITGNARTENRIDQTVQVSGETGDTFVLAGWAKGDSAHIYEEDELPSGQNLRVYALYGTFNYTDGTTSDPFIAQFNPDTDQWQYSAQVMVAKQAYSSVKVELVYDYNVNTVYFDGIQLYKEQFGSSYTYDEDGNIISVVDLQKQTTTYEYTNNDLTKEILPTGAELKYEYDNYHNVTKATTEEGQVYEFTYDAYGNNTSVAIVNGSERITSSAAYSADGNYLVSTTDALGKVTTYNYDSNTGVLNWVKYPEDTDTTKTTYTYDNMYRVASAAAATDTGLALSASYTYTDDLLTAIQTPTTTYNFNYGDFALRIKVSIGTQELARYTYEQYTNYLKELEYGNGDKVQYTYDNKGRLLTQVYENGDTVTYTYDNNGALATVTDANGVKTTYYYDFTDRMMKYVESGTGYYHSVGYEYDLINNLTSQVETINGVERTTAYTYDDDNRVISKQTGNTKVTYTYDAFGRVTTQTTYNGETLILTESFTYNSGSSQIASYTTTTSTETKTYTYTYDANGNILSIGDGTYTTAYVYDSANQLIRENNEAEGYTYTWTYDNAGNIKSREYSSYTTETPNGEHTHDYGYATGEWKDLLVSYSGPIESYGIEYDAVGNPIRIYGGSNSEEWTYTWQHGRQLASLSYSNEMEEGNWYAWNFIYNADGLRTQRTDGITTYNYVYNGSQLTAMTVGNNTLYFSYDAAGTPMSVNFNGTEYYYTSNIQGDVIGIVDATGTTVVTYSYDAWGNILSTTDTTTNNLGTLNPLRYRGYVYDQESGLYYLQSRYYDPELSRFISADDYIIADNNLLSSNMFAYCCNNPISCVDHSGEFPLLVVGLVVGCVALIGLDHVLAATQPQGGYAVQNEKNEKGARTEGLYAKGNGFECDSNGVTICDIRAGVACLSVEGEYTTVEVLDCLTAEAAAEIDWSGAPTFEASAVASIYSPGIETSVPFGLFNINLEAEAYIGGVGAGVEIDLDSGKIKITPPFAGIGGTFSVDFDFAW